MTLAHEGPLGVIPASVGTTALDVDQGDPVALIVEHPPAASFRSRRPSGQHVYWRDRKARNNGQLWLPGFGIGGDLRSAHGYLIVWHEEGWKALAAGLRHGRGVWFPAELFRPAPERETPQGPDRRPGPVPVAATWAEVPELETVLRGARNQALFDAVRFEAYGWEHGADLAAWNGRVRDHALDQNVRLPEPLKAVEVEDTAYSISTWIWSRPQLDHGPAAQARRGRKSGKSRRKKTRERDQAIVQAVTGGQSMRSVARERGIRLYTVQNILKRDAPLFARSAPLTETRPWELEGVTRRTWERRRVASDQRTLSGGCGGPGEPVVLTSKRRVLERKWLFCFRSGKFAKWKSSFFGGRVRAPFSWDARQTKAPGSWSAWCADRGSGATGGSGGTGPPGPQSGGGARGGGVSVVWQRLMIPVGALTLGVLLGFIGWVLFWTCVWPAEPIDLSWE